MRGRYDITAALAHDIDRTLIEVIITAVVDKVHRSFDKTIFGITTGIGNTGRNPRILITVHSAFIEHDTVFFGIESQSLRTIILFHAVGINETDTLEEQIFRTSHDRSTFIDMYGIVPTAQTVITDKDFLVVLTDKTKI